MEKYGSQNPYHVKVYRISARWKNDTQEGYEMTIEDNGMPIDLAVGTLVFFLISAVFHLWAVIVGLFENTWFLYWRHIDNAFCWWRWLEYSASCSLMGMLLAITLGIREQNTLVCLFVLLFTTQCFGFLNELYSRPVDHLNLNESDDESAKDNLNGTKLPTNRQWNGGFFIRQVPYFIGCIPFLVYVAVIVYHLEYQKWRLRKETNGELTIPEWVNAMLYGTIFIFSCFAVVMPIYQYISPKLYWGSEIVYSILSLTAKLWLGLLILFNVIMQEARAEEVLGTL